MKCKKNLFLLCLIVFSNYLQAQNSTGIKSSSHTYFKTLNTNDSLALEDIFAHLSRNYKKNIRNSDSAFYFIKQAQKICNNVECGILNGTLYFYMGVYHSDINKIDSSIHFFNKAKQLYLNAKMAKDVNNIRNHLVKVYYKKNNVNNNFNLQGTINDALGVYALKDTILAQRMYYYISFYRLNLQMYQEATTLAMAGIKLADMIKKTDRKLDFYRMLVDINRNIGDFENAKLYLEKVLALSPNNKLVDKALNNNYAATLYFAEGNYKKSLEIYKINLLYIDSLSNSTNNFRNQLYANVAACYNMLGDYKNGLFYNSKAIITSVDDAVIYLENKLNRGDALFSSYKGNINFKGLDSNIYPQTQAALLTESIRLLSDGLQEAKEKKLYQYINEMSPTLVKAYIADGNYKNAFVIQTSISTIKDSLLNLDQKDSIRRMQLSYEFTKKSDSVNAEKQLQRLQSEKKSALAGLAFEYDKKQMLAKTATEKLHLQQEEALKRAGIENDYNLKAATLLALQKTKELEASLTAQQNTAELKNKNKNQKLMGIGIFTGMAFLGLWFFMYNRSKQRRLKNQLALQEANQKLKDAEYATKLNNVTFDALRSQMNPHFIFNCLNSIKLYTEQNNKQVASNYLDKFSSLIRSVLDNARTEHVTLNSEIESLRLYLDLESMRFKDKLSYKINVHNNVDAEYIEIPPMLIQPYVENAIWHGLMNKPEGGTITLDFAQENDVLQATVTDNGIGRTRAAAIKASSYRTHKSLGTQITHERISLINKRYNTNANVVLTDVVDSNNNLAGTRATIQIPVI